VNITFIKPNMGLVRGQPYHDRGRMEPLTFAVLAGITLPEHTVRFIDDRFEPVPYDEPTDLVGINTEIYTARRAYEIADAYRERGVWVVLGGYHTTMIPEESAAHADAIVLGDAEALWAEIVDDAARGQLRQRYVGELASTVSLSGVRTDWSIFEGKSYLPVRLTQFSRGCPNSCEYCATGNIYAKRHATRPVAEVVRELERDGRKLVFFVDDNIIANREAAAELFRAIKPLKIRWLGQADVGFAQDPALMALMLESGCSGLVVGFESLDPSHLARMKKSSALHLDSYDEIVEAIRRAGLMIWAAFLLGYDGETPQSVATTCDWALSKKFAFAAFNILMPYPGTPLYTRLAAEGRLLYDGHWWLHDDYRFGQAGFRPSHCSPEALTAACLEARRRHSSLPNIARRALDIKTNMKDLWSVATYIAYNPLFRDEMLEKHGMMLGYRGVERGG
jgi:radical SAM superfamily enzyme YgiQ (UPF0313 family)